MYSLSSVKSPWAIWALRERVPRRYRRDQRGRTSTSPGGTCRKVRMFAKDVLKQFLRAGDRGLDLVRRYLHHVAIVETITKSMQVVQPAPLVGVPLQSHCQRLEKDGPMAFTSSQTIPASFERHAGEPESRTVRSRKSRRQAVPCRASVSETVLCTLHQPEQDIRVGICGVQCGPHTSGEIVEVPLVQTLSPSIGRSSSARSRRRSRRSSDLA
jgi:hypothetical protein